LAAEITDSAAASRLPVPGSRDEVSRLAETLNDMLGRLEVAFALADDDRTRVIASDAF
jgi:HAMP domain-containing protein